MSRIIQISELTFAARDRRRILEDLSLSVERGEIVGIVGASNAGKTLLLELLQGTLKPQSGQVLVNDRNVTRLGADKLAGFRQNLGVLPQNPVWPEQLTLESALKFKLSWLGLTAKQAQRKSDEMIQLLNLGSLQTQRFQTLTPLEQKTAYLALSLCHSPVLLLCDDPFAGIGQEGADTLSVVLQQLHEQRNLTTILTGQQPEPMSRLAHRLITLQGGALHEAQ